MSGRIIALDVGEKTIGVALSDEAQVIAQPLVTIRRQNWRADIKQVLALIEKHQVIAVVVGLPLSMDGGHTEMTERAIDFSGKLRTRTPLPVENWDERLTTVAAERALLEGDVSRKKRKEVIDQIAASLILQGWLERRANDAAR